MINPRSLAERTIELLGGRESAAQKINSELLDMQRRWHQNTDYIGRILRAHLYVEHYMSIYLKVANPRLGDLNSIRISFSQKIDLLDPNDEALMEIIPGIRQLNKIRNRLAHNLSVDITDKDLMVLLSVKSFAALRVESAKPEDPDSDPMVVLEKFSQYAATVLSHQFSCLGGAIKQALLEVNKISHE